MSRMRGKWGYYSICVLVLCALFCHMTKDRTQAVNYDSKIKRAQENKKESDSKVKELEKEIKEIEKDKNSALVYLEKLDKKTEEIENRLAKAKKEIAKTQKEVEEAEQELEEAQKLEKIQYETMTKRIRYMYENGNQDYLDMIFSSKNMSDLLNRAEYVEKISDYDKRMFSNYQKTQQTIEQTSHQLEKQLEDLESYEYEMTQEKNSLDELKRKKKEELKNYQTKAKSSKDQAEKYAKEAAKAEAEVEKLLQQKQAEIDRQNQEGSGGTGGDGTLVWPLGSSGRISSGFGHRTSPTAGASSYHRGIDIAIASGTPILAAGSGKVVTATYSASAGNYVMISHGDRLYTVYMHCSRLAVSEGTQVAQGQVIGYVGSTGISTGSHLHFGVSKDGSFVNPLNHVKQP